MNLKTAALLGGILWTIVLAAPAPGLAAPESKPVLRRFALVAGANRGSADQPPLRYAVRDAERFLRVLTALGGVAPTDAALLREPAPAAFLGALHALKDRAAAARAGAGRVEVLVYYSGHADEEGLKLGADRLSYRDLRAAIGALGADVGIAVLDACASGAITRLKGGTPHPAFLSDASSAVRGYAFLASSSESEAAQESDRLGSSYFTHALLTGLRGAADMSGDGRVTLGEAYQYAFGETLAQTTTSQGGAQHPSYDIKMAGTGDVVLTDVRKTSASLILGPDYDGRFYVLDAAGQLVAELQKTDGRTVELGLEPGDYRVYFKQSEKLLSTPLKLDQGQRQELVRGGLRPARRLPTMKRGGPAEPDRLDGHHRAEVFFGIPATGNTGRDGYVVYGEAWSLGLQRWLRPSFSLEAVYLDRPITDEDPDADPVTGSTRGVTVGGRYYPPLRGWFRPYLGLGFGGFDVANVDGLKAGGTASGGADFLLGRHLTLSLQASYVRVSGQKSLVETRAGLGVSWGRPRAAADAPDGAP